MHNIDRTVREMGNAYSNEYNEMEALFNREFSNEFEAAERFGASAPNSLNEMQEMELATELLGVSSEEELEGFFKNLAHKIGGAAQKVMNSPVGNLLKKGLKTVAPIAGAAVGGFFGGPLGAKVGSSLATGATKLFGLELEGLSGEDQEFEVARAYVRFASDAVKNASTLAQNGLAPVKVAQAAIVQAARDHAPGLLKTPAKEFESDPVDPTAPDADYPPQPDTGTWIRRGNRIIISGLVV